MEEWFLDGFQPNTPNPGSGVPYTGSGVPLQSQLFNLVNTL